MTYEKCTFSGSQLDLWRVRLSGLPGQRAQAIFDWFHKPTKQFWAQLRTYAWFLNWKMSVAVYKTHFFMGWRTHTMWARDSINCIDQDHVVRLSIIAHHGHPGEGTVVTVGGSRSLIGLTPHGAFRFPVPFLTTPSTLRFKNPLC